MKNIPTAEEFLQDHLKISHFYDDKTQNMVCYSDDVQKAMIEFAKLNVEAALKNAYDCGSFKGWAISDDENVHKEIFVKNIMSRQAIK